MRRLLVALIVATGCAASNGKAQGREVYKDTPTGFSVRFNERVELGGKGEVGEIHPAVLEYILAAGEGPLAAYYDLILGLSSPPPRARDDLRALASDARQLAAGEAPTGRHYARALARRLAPDINRALATPVQPGILTYEGTAGLWWGLPADLVANVLLRDYEKEHMGTALRTVVYRYASVDLVEVRSSGTPQVLTWDVSNISGAFDPKAKLEYAGVASRIVALHPFTLSPASAP